MMDLFIRQQLVPQRQGNSRRVGWNELHCAARDGRVEEVKRILHDVLCGVDDRTPINETALHKAVRGNSAEICKLLLVKGADPNLKNNGGRTPIYFVLGSDVTDVLLKGGADINITDNFEKITPLEFIKESKPELEAVIKLLESWQDKQTPLEIKDRGQETIAAYKAAIRHGSKPLQHIRLMLVGPERVGKTSLKKTLLGYDFDISEGKTDGIDSSVTCRVDIANVNNWQEVMNDPEYDLSQFIAMETANILKKTAIPKSTSTLSASSSSAEVLGNKNTERKVCTLADELGDDEVDGNKLPKDVNRLVNTYMKWSNGSLEEKCKLLFSVWDFAGHYLYYTMHQVFLSPRSIYCVVFDASKNLHAKADLDFFPVGSYQPIVEEFTLNHEMTNLEFLNFWISSIFSHVKANKQEHDGDGLLSPPVFIVGTHLDCITGTDEEKQYKLDKISQIIKDYLEDKAYRGHVVPEIYFVDNKFRQGESLKKFRVHVEEVMRKQPYINKMIPVSWFRFQNHVMKLRKEINYITLKEAKEISTRFGVQNEDVFNMLQLFHDVGVVAFYGEHNSNSDAFNDIVVLNPQWLIIVFTKIITINKDEENWPAYKRCWSKLEEEGILEESLVNHVWSEFPKSQRESLLQIMQRFDLLCENKVQSDEGEIHYTEEGQFRRQFFVPCQLKPNKEDIDKVWELECNAVVINIIPKDGFLPEGLFHRLTVRAAVWTQQKECCQSKQPRLYYRQTELYLDEDHELIMRMHVTRKGNRMIKIIIYYPPVENDESSRSPTPSMCKEVFIFLLNSLKNLKMMWMKQIDFLLCVPCYTCKEFDDHHHLLETCLKLRKTDCGKKRNSTAFWQTLFGDRQVNQVGLVKHPLESLTKTNHNETNKMPVSSPGTGLMSSPEIDNSEIISSSKRLITELTPADDSNQDKSVNISVIGHNNIVIVGNKGSVEINEARQSTNNSVKIKRAAEKLDPNVHKCRECDRVCQSKAGLVSHLRRHSVKRRTGYSPDKPTRKTGEGSCSNRSSPQAQTLQTHENTKQTRQ